MAEYEFSAEENQQIDRLRRKIRNIALLFVTLGVMQLVESILLPDQLGRWISLAASLGLLALGWLFWRPLDNLRRIIATTGKDIREVVMAMKDLRAAYLVAEIIMFLLAAGVLIELMRLISGSGV